jgi:2',3'-cyclic-nucleotide 2'-phosphodiesterase (5'-nucleotidase family)
MVKLKKSALVLKCFGLLLTFFILISCGEQKNFVTKIEGKKIGITENQTENADIEKFIQPYRENIDKDLNEVLAYNPENLEKSKGEWQTNIGNFLADITFHKSNKIFQSRENKSIAICILNHGGIRTMIPKGNVTARNAFEVMPFENTAVVVALKGSQIIEMANHIIAEKKPHPLKGLTFTIDKNNTAKNILVQNEAIDSNAIYYVVTSDYLANGGDNMIFFKQGIQRYDIDYKLRNILIDYFKEVDTISYDNSVRITKE